MTTLPKILFLFQVFSKTFTISVIGYCRNIVVNIGL